eukprot:2888125-Alexandrium_andersonii.AAC.1
MEGGPASPEAVYVIAEWLALHKGPLAALAALLALDCYLREQDWQMLKVEDIFVEEVAGSPPRVAL